MSLFPFALTYSGWAALCFAMSRHAREVLQREPTPLQRHLLRAAGWIALIVSLFMAAAHAGWPIGTVEWFGMLTASAVSFVLLLTYRPRLAAGLGLGLPVCALVGHFLVSAMMH
ncbi:DUF3325 domain-containing protein [Steroidobacter flavus]|uniref:DUF3325 domain-containing protein n=1 Tax=Steroidobacter flavus TaxID=1842136 RepID=A0ABV8SU93_9GAMM